MKVFYHKTYKWKDVVLKCYETDQDLLDKFHILAPANLQEAVNHTCQTFVDISNKGVFEMFEATLDDVFIGYFAVEHVTVPYGKLRLLNGFFLLPEYRKPDVKKAFIECVRKKFPNGILTGLYSKNERAIKFFKKMGAQEVSKNEVLMPIRNENTSVEYVILGLQ